MAATDQFYRPQKTLDVVFGVSCVLLLATTVWMFVQDYNRDFKAVQRTFRDVEAALAERKMASEVPDLETFEAKQNAAKAARDNYDDARASIRDRDRQLTAKMERAEAAYRDVKARFDAQASYVIIAVDEASKAEGAPRYDTYAARAKSEKDELERLQTKLNDARKVFDAAELEYKEQVRKVLDPAEKQVADTDADLKKVTGAFDRYAKLAAQKRWGFGDTFRKLPILDAFESPTKIKQIWLPDLTIDYSFKEVPRYDRCTTCHLGIDQADKDRATLTDLGDPAEKYRLDDRLRDAHQILAQRKAAGEKLGFDPSSLPPAPTKPPAITTGHIALALLLCTVVLAFVLGFFLRSAVLGGSVLAAGLLISGGVGAWALSSDDTGGVKMVRLTPGQVVQYAVHPRLDLFVDSNSPHSMEKFGCTICHGGQGSATDFGLAAHTPTDAHQQAEWIKQHGWEHSHFWDFPMLSKRFVESSCVKCHHDMTDLIRHGVREEAPKLLRGYNLVKENGCFGCHEISGLKSGRRIGPDLRLESSPALDFLTAAEQARIKDDLSNPPGMMRKVGPSLRRLAEKTNQEWTRQWVFSPRGFRPDTKMPHFYGLSTNSEEALAGTGQEKFPATEIHAITHYLFAESKAALEGKDTYRQFLRQGLGRLHGDLKKRALSDRELKDQSDLTRRFTDLALLSAPLNARGINAAAGELKHAQERMQVEAPPLRMKERALKDKEKERTITKDEQAELKALPGTLTALGDALDRALARIEELSKPAPLARGLLTQDGGAVDLPAKPGDAMKGRELFMERGCLACHSHDGTSKSLEKTKPGVTSQANFAPDLTRIAAKLAPELGGKEANRRWLVQWLLNPNVHHPRTRMPITHLTPEQANDVAAWLLAQRVTDWKGESPATPSEKDLIALARVHFAKAPTITTAEVNEFLPLDGKPKPLPRERRELLPADADEQQLGGTAITREKLLWYVGRKAVGRQGCYACHDVPGFETAKPIGTGLNDWGKKDPDRLAFEDAESFVKEHFNIVEGRLTPDEATKRIDELQKKSSLDSTELRELRRLEKLRAEGKLWARDAKGHEPFEEAFSKALEHHGRSREGFLHLKLLDPRSYDHNRIKAWDDRLRMPQFKFARIKRKPNESKEAYEARQDKEEAEAREAVMTFILGLVADPIPLKYLNAPNRARMDEVKGREVLDKYNCAGCHQIRPGVYEFGGPETIKTVQDAYTLAAGPEFLRDHVFPGHNAWTGTAQPSGRMMAFGIPIPQLAEEDFPGRKGALPVTQLRLVDAFRFTGEDGVTRDLPGGTTLRLPPKEILQRVDPLGGTFAELMVPYHLRKAEKKPDDQPEVIRIRSGLPPPLIREGERVQPDWLYRFLLNPGLIRPTEFMTLRMPRFNMSPDESRALVNYFAAVSKVTNPGAGVTYPYVTLAQRDPEYWRERNAEYRRRLQERPVPEILKTELAAVEKALPGELEAADKAEKAKASDAKQKREAANQTQAKIKLLKDFAAEMKRRAKSPTPYADDALRLLTNKDLCLKCHSLGNLAAEPPQGPNLIQTAERLRPEWIEKWIANPDRMFPYKPHMPQNFANEANPAGNKYQELFLGTALEQTRAARDILMDPQRLANLAPAAAGGKK
jgi:cytochrome c peroxidase